MIIMGCGIPGFTEKTPLDPHNTYKFCVFALYSLVCRSHIVLSWCIVLGSTCYICTCYYHSTQPTLSYKKGSEGKPKFNEYIVP